MSAEDKATSAKATRSSGSTLSKHMNARMIQGTGHQHSTKEGSESLLTRAKQGKEGATGAPMDLYGRMKQGGKKGKRI